MQYDLARNELGHTLGITAKMANRHGLIAGATGTDDDRVELAARQAVGELVQIVDHVLMLSRG